MPQPSLEEEKIIGERFASERERLELSQQKFGDLVGLQQAGVNAVEKEYRTEAGTLRSTSVEKFIRSAKVFNCSLELIWRYAGFSEMNRKSTSREYVRAKGNWPAIITEQEAEMLLAEVARRADAPRTVSHVKLFSGVVICARCNHVMSVQTDIGYGSALRCENVTRFGTHKDGTPKKATVSHKTLMAALRSDLLDLQNETTRAEILAAAQKSVAPDASQEQLDALEARLKRLEAAQQRIDSDYYIEERIDTARHTALSSDIARQVKEAEQQREQLRHKLNEQYNHDHFAQSLADTAQHGQERLAWPVRDANAWLRQTLRIYVQDCAVVEIKYLPPNYML